MRSLTTGTSAVTDEATGVSGCNVVVVGDIGIDRFIAGTYLGKDFLESNRETFHGFAATTVTGLLLVAKDVRLVSIIGDDCSGVDLRDALDVAGISTRWVGTAPVKTTVRTTYEIDEAPVFSTIEVDRRGFGETAIKCFCMEIRHQASWADVFLLRDYGFGLITKEVRDCIEKTGKRIIESTKCIARQNVNGVVLRFPR